MVTGNEWLQEEKQIFVKNTAQVKAVLQIQPGLIKPIKE